MCHEEDREYRRQMRRYQVQMFIGLSFVWLGIVVAVGCLFIGLTRCG